MLRPISLVDRYFRV